MEYEVYDYTSPIVNESFPGPYEVDCCDNDITRPTDAEIEKWSKRCYVSKKTLFLSKLVTVVYLFSIIFEIIPRY